MTDDERCVKVADAIRRAHANQLNVSGVLDWRKLQASEQRRWMDLGIAAMEAIGL